MGQGRHTLRSVSDAVYPQARTPQNSSFLAPEEFCLSRAIQMFALLLLFIQLSHDTQPHRHIQQAVTQDSAN